MVGDAVDAFGAVCAAETASVACITSFLCRIDIVTVKATRVAKVINPQIVPRYTRTAVCGASAVLAAKGAELTSTSVTIRVGS
jgi:hypothetical protein